MLQAYRHCIFRSAHRALFLFWVAGEPVFEDQNIGRPATSPPHRRESKRCQVIWGQKEAIHRVHRTDHERRRAKVESPQKIQRVYRASTGKSFFLFRCWLINSPTSSTRQVATSSLTSTLYSTTRKTLWPNKGEKAFSSISVTSLKYRKSGNLIFSSISFKYPMTTYKTPAL